MRRTLQYDATAHPRQLFLPFSNSRGSVESGWQHLDSLNTYLALVRDRLLPYEECRAKFYDFQDYLWAGFWSSGGGIEWASELWKRGMGGSTVYCSQEPLDSAASVFAYAPCDIGELRRRLISEFIGRARDGSFRLASSLKSLLLRFAATAYQFRNKMSLQRRFYLTHGAHPVEELVRLEGRLSPKTGGGAVAFQQ
jgi:hypothetical protein